MGCASCGDDRGLTPLRPEELSPVGVSSFPIEWASFSQNVAQMGAGCWHQRCHIRNRRGGPVIEASGRLLRWAPRVLGALTCLFLGLFALDVFNEQKTFVEALPAFAIHVAPAVILCAIVVASWNREWIAGTVFTVLGLAYIGLTRGHLDWVLLISGPLLAVGALFLLSWRQHTRRHTPSARP